VTDEIHDAFVDRLCTATKALTVGDARAPDTQIGPVASAAQLAINEQYATRAMADGATLAAGGGEVPSKTPGHYFASAPFIGVPADAAVARNEIFDPIAAVLRAPDYESALAIANDSEFGLSAGIVSQDATLIDHFVRHAEAGMIQVNLPTAGMDFHAPFTGRKGSSYGLPEKGSYCRKFFTAARVVRATKSMR